MIVNIIFGIYTFYLAMECYNKIADIIFRRNLFFGEENKIIACIVHGNIKRISSEKKQCHKKVQRLLICLKYVI